MLRELRSWCDEHGVLLLLDEVMTGFGRTGKMFACEHEEVIPDFLCLAKGITGGYMPLGATLTTEKIFDAFLGAYQDTFFYGHSYCANPLGCAVALASLEVFEQEDVLESLPKKIDYFEKCISEHFVRNCEYVTRIHQTGLIAGIEIGPFDFDQFMGAKVCNAARKHGLLTRPVRDTLVLMPPLCSTTKQIEQMVEALRAGFDDCI